MSLSMYRASIPAFVQMLNNLAAILDKAEAHAGNRKIDLGWGLIQIHRHMMAASASPER